MDVFALRDQVVGEYERYVRGFLVIREADLREKVDAYFSAQHLWPEPMVQLNPTFARGRSVDDLVAAGDLHEGCGRAFRRRDAAEEFGASIPLHWHQEEAIRVARSGKSYVLTTCSGPAPAGASRPSSSTP